VIVGRAQGGLDPARFLIDILGLHGVDAFSTVAQPGNVLQV
jgi:hypothetical protein